MINKKAVDKHKTKLQPHEDSRARLDPPEFTAGVHGTRSIEPLPQYIATESEQVISNGNSSIVLGRDRPAQRTTGYGGSGDTQAYSIDMVVGRMAHAPDSKMYCDPDFNIDSARIYISQKSDIDEYFGLAPGSNIGKAKSAIGIKADDVRIISREGMKIVAGFGNHNSQGGNISDVLFGVDIMANNNDSDLQPIPKGKNLEEALKRLTHHVHKLNGIVEGQLMEQDKLNKALTDHWHISTAPGKRTSPSFAVMYAGYVCNLKHLIKTKFSFRLHRMNLESYQKNYLEQQGSQYINSRYNKVN